jgi:hypothetical protein
MKENTTGFCNLQINPEIGLIVVLRYKHNPYLDKGHKFIAKLGN